jgi:hypothetical protein
MLVNQRIQALDFQLQPLAFVANGCQCRFASLLLVHQHIGTRGKNRRQGFAHAISQLDEAARFSGLALEGVPLPIDFRKNIVHARQVQAGRFQARLGKLALGFELGDTRGLFNQGASIHRFRAQQLANAALFNDGVAVGSEPRAEKHIVNVAQPAGLSVDEVHTLAVPIQTALDDDVARSGDRSREVFDMAMPITAISMSAVSIAVPITVAVSIAMAIPLPRAAAGGAGFVSVRVMVTSAIPIGARLRLPLKMTSSIFSPRRDLALCSPRTQAMASETLLLPQPLGPTIAVTPVSLTAICPLSENDLNPTISMRRSFNTNTPSS